MKATVTVTYHAAEIERLEKNFKVALEQYNEMLNARNRALVIMVEQDEKITSLNEQLETEKEESRRVEQKLAIAEAALKNVDDGWPYREYEERLYEEKL